VCEEPESGALLELATPGAANEDRRSKKKKFEDDLLQTIKDGTFEEIEKEVTPKAFKRCESNALVMGMKVSFELRRLADSKGPDEERFNQLATSVEKFTTCLLDPLKANPSKREEFGDALDEILDDAIQLKQKKFFTHPVVDAEMRRKWYGRSFMKSEWKRWRLLFSIWCLFDLMFSLILYAFCSLIRIHQERKRKRGKDTEEAISDGDELQEATLKKTKAKKQISVTQIYPVYLETPYFTFLRDTLSYISLLVLHYALCLAPSSIEFSGLEWAILIFFIGRYLVERQQICDVMLHIKRQRENSKDDSQSKVTLALKALAIYQRDLWNRLDFISLLVYLVIFSLRIATFIISGTVVNNRVLIIAGYLYSFNTLCLTFRVFGHVMEQSKDVGTIQIALFSILKNIRTIIWQFTAAIVAFSIAITKIYMAEKSYVPNASNKKDIVCKASGLSCWWAMITYLGWSLLGLSDGLDAITSVDLPSVILAQILLAGFLIMGVILLINMLIALLSNTYQHIEDNSLQEWSFKKAATIQTYDAYDPIPVPLNIIYSIFKLLRLVGKKDKTKGILMQIVVIDLDREYFAKHGNFFPVTDKAKDDLVVRETVRNRQMVSQILTSTFKSQNIDQGLLYSGPEAWQLHAGIRVEGPLLTCVGMAKCSECNRRPSKQHWPGARYLTAFSPEFPHFEVAILETGKQILLGIGVVDERYDTSKMPGWKNGTLGFHTDGTIFDAANSRYGRETRGPAVALRGDRVRCTVKFEDEQERNGKLQVPVLFTLNGRKIMIHDGEDSEFFIDSNKPLFPYIGMNDGCSVVAKMCSRGNEEYLLSKMAELEGKVTKMESSLDETTRKLEASLKETNRKLDTLLASLTIPPAQDQGLE